MTLLLTIISLFSLLDVILVDFRTRLRNETGASTVDYDWLQKHFFVPERVSVFLVISLTTKFVQVLSE